VSFLDVKCDTSTVRHHVMPSSLFAGSIRVVLRAQDVRSLSQSTDNLVSLMYDTFAWVRAARGDH
jgi:hypothetical protein